MDQRDHELTVTQVEANVREQFGATGEAVTITLFEDGHGAVIDGHELEGDTFNRALWAMLRAIKAWSGADPVPAPPV